MVAQAASTTASTQPSTSASAVSSRSSAACWAGVGSMSNSPSPIARCIDSGSDGSIELTAFSIALPSTAIPRA